MAVRKLKLVALHTSSTFVLGLATAWSIFSLSKPTLVDPAQSRLIYGGAEPCCPMGGSPGRFDNPICDTCGGMATIMCSSYNPGDGQHTMFLKVKCVNPNNPTEQCEEDACKTYCDKA